MIPEDLRHNFYTREKEYMDSVEFPQIALYTLIQLISFAAIFCITFSPAAVIFPVLIGLLIFIRVYVLPLEMILGKKVDTKKTLIDILDPLVSRKIIERRERRSTHALIENVKICKNTLSEEFLRSAGSPVSSGGTVGGEMIIHEHEEVLPDDEQYLTLTV